jgi:branched-chain amino acid transport system permease protein
MSEPTNAADAPTTAKRGRRSIGARFSALPRPAKIALFALLTVFAYALPLLNLPFIATPDSDFGGVLFSVAVYGIVALGLNVVIGYAGLLDLGYVGFYAVGAYSVAVVGSLHGKIPWLLAVPIAMGVALISGIILGAPTLRVRGDYLAIVTLGFGEIIRLAALNSSWLGAAAGVSNVPKPPSVSLFDVPSINWDGLTAYVDNTQKTTVLKFGIIDQVPYYWLAITVVILVLFAERRLKDSRVGRAWEATREDEDAAELMGVPTFRYKLLAFAIGACIGGLSGALFAARQGFVSPDTFTIQISVLFVAAVVIGGAGNRWGVLLGAFAVVYVPERLRFLSDYRVLIFGLALMTLAIFRPQGLIPPRRTVRAKKVEENLEALEEGAANA